MSWLAGPADGSGESGCLAECEPVKKQHLEGACTDSGVLLVPSIKSKMLPGSFLFEAGSSAY